jgi:hypothetical protein
VSRADILADLIEFRRPLDELSAALRTLPWDVEAPEAVLEPRHIIGVLGRFQSKETSAADVDRWANLIECRDDIVYEAEWSEEILEAIHVLANPLIMGALDDHLADEVIASLSS